MKELNIGNRKVRVRATALALLFYKQEFKSDLLGDLMKMAQGMAGIQSLLRKGENDLQIDHDSMDLSQLDTVMLLQLIWAMAKADQFGKPFPSFFEWVSSIGDFNLFDPTILRAVMEEATEGFFRPGAKNGANFEKNRGNQSHRNRAPRRG
ncbi:hypothetical protein [Brevibacillus porteri]|uniref:hypothetical protein n=1 Tax=Brevibacillus porteri TaxID=2126350 RepID=UPI003D1988B8